MRHIQKSMACLLASTRMDGAHECPEAFDGGAAKQRAYLVFQCSTPIHYARIQVEVKSPFRLAIRSFRL